MTPADMFQLAIEATRAARARSATAQEARLQLFLELGQDVGRMDATPQKPSAAVHLSKVRSGGIGMNATWQGNRVAPTGTANWKLEGRRPCSK